MKKYEREREKSNKFTKYLKNNYQHNIIKYSKNYQ